MVKAHYGQGTEAGVGGLDYRVKWGSRIFLYLLVPALLPIIL